MKLIEKIFINEHERIIKILGLNFSYSKSRDSESRGIKYSVKLGNFAFNFYKKKNGHRRKYNLLRMDKEKLMYLLIYSKCLRNMFSKNDMIQTLVLGSSTARCSYIEDLESLNMGIDAQDLYYSYKLFDKLKRHLPNLKNLVLYYDVFSMGNDADISSGHEFVSAYYKAFFDIPYKNKLVAIQNNAVALENRIYENRKYINENLNNIPKDIMSIVHGGLQTKEDMLAWAKAELKLSNKGNMNKYLENLLMESENLNIYILF